jgi:DNA-binding MarR family transcriptional regulator
MSSPQPDLGVTWRRILARALVFHDALAARLGINPTDLRCLELVAVEQPLTPSRLAELADLTSGAVTGVLDRLEGAGFVRREPDPNDRRRQVVRVVGERLDEVTRLYAPFLVVAGRLPDALDAAGRRAVVAHLEGVARSLDEQTSAARVASRGGMIGDTYVAPLAGATHGRLVFASGAPRLSLNAAALGQQMRMVAETSASRLALSDVTTPDELIHARFDGPPPEVRTIDGTVSIRYRRRLLDTRSRAAAIALNQSIPWTIEVDGGVTDLDADLRSLGFGGLTVRGGANHMRLQLPLPDRTVRVSLAGGASNVRIARPADVAVALLVRGGVSRLRLDDQRMRSVGGELRLQSASFPGALERYEIEISGGASDLTIEGLAGR